MSDNFDFDFDFGDSNNSSDDSSFDFNFNDSSNNSNDAAFNFDESSNDFDFGDNSNTNYEFESTQFDNNAAFDESSKADDSKDKLKKTAIIIMAVGIGLLIITFLIGSLVNKKDNKQKQLDTSVITVVDNNAYNNVQNNNVNNIISSGNPESTNSVITNNSYNTKKSDWTEIDANQQVFFNSEYTSLTFTITGIKHLAHVTDNNLHVKTVLSGSLSGLSGTYEVEVPYNKGVMLSVGNEFTVNVLLGNYNQKTVIGDIKY